MVRRIEDLFQEYKGEVEILKAIVVLSQSVSWTSFMNGP